MPLDHIYLRGTRKTHAASLTPLFEKGIGPLPFMKQRGRVMTRKLFCVGFLFLCSSAVYAQATVEEPPQIGDMIGETRTYEAFDSYTGVYEATIASGQILSVIDHETQAVYISDGTSTLTVPITPDLLDQAGLTSLEFNSMMSTPGTITSRHGPSLPANTRR